MGTLLIILIVAYGCFVAGFFLSEKLRRPRRSKTDGPVVPPSRGAAPDVVGRSLFRMPARSVRPEPAETSEGASRSRPETNADTDEEAEEVADADVIFADATEEGHPARISDDDLDAAFADIRIEDVAGGEEPDENPTAGYARGESFEAIDAAVRTVRTADATDEQTRQAGRVFAGLQDTELFACITERFAAVGERVTQAIESYLHAAGSVGKQAFTLPETIEDFDIRDYV